MASEEVLRARVGYAFKREVEDFCALRGMTISHMVVLGIDRVMNADSIEETLTILEEILGIPVKRKDMPKTGARMIQIFRKLDEVRGRLNILSGGDPRKEIPPLLAVVERMEKGGEKKARG